MSDRLGTFEGAAQGVAALNISLGGSFVNAFDLAMAKSKGPMAQLNMMRDAIEASGKNLDELGVREKEFLQDELGERFGLLERLLQGDVLTEADLKVEPTPTLEEAVTRSTTVQELLQASTQAATQELTKTTQGLRDVKVEAGELIKAIGGLQMVMIGLGIIGTSANLFSAFQSSKIAKGMTGFLGGGGGGIARQASRMKAGDAILNRSLKTGGGGGGGGAGGLVTAGAKSTAILSSLGSKGTDKVIEAAAEEAIENTTETIAKKVVQEGGEAAAGSLLKKIPLLGLGMGLFFGAQRAFAGDFTGAAMEVASGAASTLPGAGTAASIGIDAALLAKDVGMFDSATPTRAATPKSAPKVTMAQNNAAKQNAMLRQEMAMLRKSIDSNSQTENKQPIKVDLYLNKSGTHKIAEASLDVLDNKYLSRGRVSNP